LLLEHLANVENVDGCHDGSAVSALNEAQSIRRVSHFDGTNDLKKIPAASHARACCHVGFLADESKNMADCPHPIEVGQTDARPNVPTLSQPAQGTGFRGVFSGLIASSESLPIGERGCSKAEVLEWEQTATSGNAG
jgi:hypothetical protein